MSSINGLLLFLLRLLHQPFHSQEWSIWNFPRSLIRNTTSHSMKNLAFHSLLRWNMITTKSHYLTYTFLFKSLGECENGNWENVLFELRRGKSVSRRILYFRLVGEKKFFSFPCAFFGFAYLLLGQDDHSQQLIFQAFHCDREVDDGGLGANLRCVGGVTQLGGDVQSEAIHDVNFFVADFDLESRQNKRRISNVASWSPVPLIITIMASNIWQKLMDNRALVLEALAPAPLVLLASRCHTTKWYNNPFTPKSDQF